LRLDKAFKLERQKERSLDYEFNVLRVLRTGCMAMPQNVDQGFASITVPDDMDAFAVGLCTDIEWLPFERFRQDAPATRARYYYAELSDKGRYQLAVIDRFASVTEAFDVLMNGYWRDVLLRLGAVPAEKNVALRDQFVTRLRRRLGQPQGALNFNTQEDVEKLAREAIRIGRQLQRETRYVDYKSLKRDWDALVGEAEKENRSPDAETNAYYREVRHLDNSIKCTSASKISFIKGWNGAVADASTATGSPLTRSAGRSPVKYAVTKSRRRCPKTGIFERTAL
jgi:hypothetical protein